MAKDVARLDNPLPPEEVLFGASRIMGLVRKKLDTASRTSVPILIRGELGTGKELLARFIHRRYPGETAAFYKVEHGVCESGQDRFASPGKLMDLDASSLCQPAEDPVCIGTVYFDDVAELNAASQRSLMQLLQDDQPRGTGSVGCLPGLLRVICGTQHDIRQEMDQGIFRQDLFYSLSVVSVNIPALRERREDIPGFLHYFWKRYKEECRPDALEPSRRLVEVFRRYDWPGNIRQLADTVKRCVISGSEEKILNELSADMVRPLMHEPFFRGDVSLKSLTRQEVQELERDLILKALRATQWNRRLAARALNISYRALLYKIKAAGVPHKRIV